MKVNMLVAEVLQRVYDNRNVHRELFKKACDGYKRQFIDMLNVAIDDLKSGKTFSHNLYLLAPEDHTDDYNYVIKMLEMTIDKEIQLGERDVAQFIMDDWGWKKQWTETVTSYSGK